MIRIEIRRKKYRLIPKTNHLRFTSETWRGNEDWARDI